MQRLLGLIAGVGLFAVLVLVFLAGISMVILGLALGY